MNKIKYNIDLMKYISLFESLTNAQVKDCIENELQIIFIVNENEIGKAIGKNGINAKKISNLIKKPIKIVEFSSDVSQFIKNFVYPVQIKEVRNQDNLVTIVGPDTKTRGMLIGRDAKNLETLKSVVKRYFTINDIKVM